MKKTKAKLSEAKNKIGKTNWASLKKTSTTKANQKPRPALKSRG